MAKKRKNSEDDDYDEEGEDDDDDDEDDNYDTEEEEEEVDEEEEAVKEKPVPKTFVFPAKKKIQMQHGIEPELEARRRKRKQERKNEDDLSDEGGDYDGNTRERMTANGGYAHTLTSKLRISKANRGREPWNKGGKRSAADKAKISEGVLARNRAILLEKLEVLGLTEEEWLKKKKTIKYLREKVRKAKKQNQLKDAAEQQKELNEALAETTVVGKTETEKNKVPRKKKKKAKPVDTENKYAKKVLMSKTKTKADKPSTTTNEDEDEPEGEEPSRGDSQRKQKRKRTKQKESAAIVPDALHSTVAAAITVATANPGSTLPAIFTRDVNWTYHPFDSSESASPYDSTCAQGGPGGFICCEDCTKNYSGFLTETSKDMEHQKTQKVNNEVQELLGILSGARSKLNNALRAAKNKAAGGSFIAHRGTAATLTQPSQLKKAPLPVLAQQRPGELPQLPGLSFQFNDCPDLPPLAATDTSDGVQLPAMQPFDMDIEGAEAVAV